MIFLIPASCLLRRVEKFYNADYRFSRVEQHFFLQQLRYVLIAWAEQSYHLRCCKYLIDFQVMSASSKKENGVLIGQTKISWRHCDLKPQTQE